MKKTKENFTKRCKWQKPLWFLFAFFITAIVFSVGGGNVLHAAGAPPQVQLECDPENSTPAEGGWVVKTASGHCETPAGTLNLAVPSNQKYIKIEGFSACKTSDNNKNTCVYNNPDRNPAGFNIVTGDDMFKLESDALGFVEYPMGMTDDLAAEYTANPEKTRARLLRVLRDPVGNIYDERGLMVPSGPYGSYGDYLRFKERAPSVGDAAVTVEEACYPVEVSMCPYCGDDEVADWEACDPGDSAEEFTSIGGGEYCTQTCDKVSWQYCDRLDSRFVYHKTNDAGRAGVEIFQAAGMPLPAPYYTVLGGDDTRYGSMPSMSEVYRDVGSDDLSLPCTYRCRDAGEVYDASLDACVVPQAGICSPNSGAIATDPPVTHLNAAALNATAPFCDQGQPSKTSFTDSEPWEWTCSGIGGAPDVVCVAGVTSIDAACSPAADGQSFADAAALNAVGTFCNEGDLYDATGTNPISTFADPGPWDWTCKGTNGGADVSCSASQDIIPGTCNPSIDGQTFASAADANAVGDLCTEGTASIPGLDPLAAPGDWNWTCEGSDGTLTACSATFSPVIDGVCGTAIHNFYDNAPADSEDLCWGGTPTPRVEVLSGANVEKWTWECTGAGGGANASCEAYKRYNECGSAVWDFHATAPTTDLCRGSNLDGAVTLNASNQWEWKCTSWDGANTKTCYARTPEYGKCGSANDGVYAAAPPAGDLCSSGTATPVSDLPAIGATPAMWGWTCQGNPPGISTIDTCFAYKPSATPICGADIGTCAEGTGTPVNTSDGITMEWNCELPPAAPVSCSASRPLSSCGPVSGGSFETLPATGLCPADHTVSSGPTDVGSPDVTGWEWACRSNKPNATINPNCEATRIMPAPLPLCGSKHNTVSASEPENAGACAEGTDIGMTTNSDGTFAWQCENTDGVTVDCRTNPPTPVCASASNGKYFDDLAALTAAGLCDAGVANPATVDGNGWKWQCQGNGSVNCTANKTVAPACGTAIHNTCQAGTAPANNLCWFGDLTTGTMTETADSWTWGCSPSSLEWGGGAPTANDACSCSKNAVNGQCGDADGQPYSDAAAATAAGLCDINHGPDPAISGDGPWNWTCTGNGVSGATDAPCSANILDIPAQCGNAAGKFFATMPTTNLCGTDNTLQEAVTFDDAADKWNWTCESSTGNTIDCNADGPACLNPAWELTKHERFTEPDEPTFCNSYMSPPDSAECVIGSDIGKTYQTQKRTYSKGLCLVRYDDYTCQCDPGITPEPEVAGQCGDAHGQPRSNEPTSASDLCSHGEATTRNGPPAGPWTWSCVAGGGVADCATLPLAAQEPCGGYRCNFSGAMGAYFSARIACSQPKGSGSCQTDSGVNVEDLILNKFPTIKENGSLGYRCNPPIPAGATWKECNSGVPEVFTPQCGGQTGPLTSTEWTALEQAGSTQICLEGDITNFDASGSTATWRCEDPNNASNFVECNGSIESYEWVLVDGPTHAPTNVVGMPQICEEVWPTTYQLMPGSSNNYGGCNALTLGNKVCARGPCTPDCAFRELECQLK